MERKIKFRGFNRKNNVWLYGFYLQNRGAHFVCPDEFAGGKSWEDYEIDLETLGEYTCLKDKNGREIYEGDVVYVYDFAPAYAIKYRGVVKMIHCEWIVEVENEYYGPAHHKLDFYDFAGRKTEVIGNIHDTPEFLKQQ